MDLTGFWRCNDNGTYYLRQDGATLWWAGLSHNGDFGVSEFNDGLDFCNLFQGTIGGNTVRGTWIDVPRGATKGSGTLSLAISGSNASEQRLVRNQTPLDGGFGGSEWHRIITLFPSPPPVRELFKVTRKNIVRNGHWSDMKTLDDDLTCYKEIAILFGTVAAYAQHSQTPVTLEAFPDKALKGTTYRDFITYNDPPRLDLGLGDQKDLDITFHLSVNPDLLRLQQGFYSADWDDLSQIDKVRGQMLQAALECELIMYGKAAYYGQDEHYNDPPLFPGWAESPKNAVLYNGRSVPVVNLPPGVGTTDPDIRNLLSFGNPIRVTGALVNDKGHGLKLEIHPVYSVDRITDISKDDLTGIWSDYDGTTYYLRQLDNSIWWLALNPTRYSRNIGAVLNQPLSSIFRGTRSGQSISGTMVAVPKYPGGGDTPVIDSFSLDLQIDSNNLKIRRPGFPPVDPTHEWLVKLNHTGTVGPISI